MKESNSFQDVLKQVLVPEKKITPVPKPKRKKRSNYVSEAIHGGNTSSPTSVSVQGARLGGTQGMPPFSKYTADTTSGHIDMRDIGKAEDDKAKSNNRKPYPLETVLDYIAHSGEDLQNAQSMIELSLKKNISLSDSQKETLKKIKQTLSSSLGNIGKAAKFLNSINLS